MFEVVSTWFLKIEPLYAHFIYVQYQGGFQQEFTFRDGKSLF